MLTENTSLSLSSGETYLKHLDSMKNLQKSLEDAGLCDESEIIKLAIMSLFCKYDMQNEAMEKMN